MKLRLSMLLAILALVMAIAPAGTAQALYSDCHTVQPGETLSEIADHYNVTVQAIMQANHLDDPDVIYVGQCLVIPTKGSYTPPTPAKGCTYHTVKRGETLSEIAAHYHVSVASICNLNNLRNPNVIYPGQHLKIKCTGGTSPTPPPSSGTWKGQYWNNRLLSGSPKYVRNTKAISYNWGTGGPGGGVGPDNFSVRWTTKKYFSGGNFRFTITVDDGVRFWIDGKLVIDQWHDSAATTYTADRQLSKGNHNLQVDYYEHTGQARIKFGIAKLNGAPSDGWLAEYFENRNLEGTPKISRLEPTLDHDWGQGAPIPGFPADNFSARWTRDIHFDAGTYCFKVTADDGVQLLIDGNMVIDQWHDGSATYGKDVHLDHGTHRVRVKYYEAGGFARIKLSWSKECVGSGPWKAEYYNNTNAQGSRVLIRQEQAINYTWGNKSPGPGVTADYYSVVWTGTFFFKQGTYRFTATMDDGMRVYVDGMRIIGQWHDGAVRTVWVDMSLQEGNHSVRVEYYERQGDAVAKLSWAKR